MSATSKNGSNWQNWTYFGLRWLFLIVVAVSIPLAQGRNLSPFEFDTISDVVIAVGLGVVLTIALGVFILVGSLRPYVMYVALPGDWILTALLVGISTQVDAQGNVSAYPELVLGIMAGLVVAGFLRFGTSLGVIHLIGVLIATVAGLFVSLGLDALTADPLIYLPVLLFLLTIAAAAGAWIYQVYPQQNKRVKELKLALRKQTNHINQLRESARAVAEMSATLNATLNYDKILDAAMDVGRISLRKNPKQRVVSMVMLFTPDDKLQIVTARGLGHLDEGRVIRGSAGIVGEALMEGIPVVGGDPAKDQELSEFVALRNIRSVLCIPLRAGFDNFGVLVYGTEQPNAFTTGQTEILNSIGTQATVALQNAVLYENLKNDRERLIEMEEQARKELVRDLHDVPTQTMSAVAMELSIIPKLIERNNPQQAVEEVNRIRDMALRATDEIRHVLFSLRPLSLESQGLNAALRQLADKMQGTYRQRMDIRVEDSAENYLDANQRGTLFYLIEEAANNARKYANASVVRVTVAMQGDFIVVKIIDDGDGFDMKVLGNYSERGSFGMVNMRERAELVDGAFDIKSAPGKGTVITVTVPIKPEMAAIAEAAAAQEPATRLEAAARQRLGM